MLDKRFTNIEIEKAQTLLAKLEEAYNAYYDTSKGMPYDIDETLRETIICLKNSINEIACLQAEKAQLATLAELGNMRANDYRVMRDRALTAEEEVERLENEVKTLIENSITAKLPHCVFRGNGAILTRTLNEYDELIGEIKIEAYKEFAMWLKEIDGKDNHNFDDSASILISDEYKKGRDDKTREIWNTIDSLLSEKVGLKNG